MSRKFGGKCFAYSPRTIPELPMTNVGLGGLDGFDLSKNNPTMREDEPNAIMRKRREGGYSERFRQGDGDSCRSTTTNRLARILEEGHSHRSTDYQSV